MDFSGWNSFEDLAKACGYTNSNKGSNNKSETNNENSTNEFYNMGCYDIPNGFQDLDPQLFILIGEIFGNILSGSIPFNVQNALGNWLQLVGQVIETYNAQQQYFQSGPGRYFNPKYYNVSNSFCNTSNDNSSSKSSEKNECIDQINDLKNTINDLIKEIEEIKNKL